MTPATEPHFRIGTWNTEWAKPASKRGRRVRPALAEPDCNVLCITEGYAGILPEGGHVIDAGPDWGYAAEADRRKVLLWSKRPWTDIDALGSPKLPSGRFVAGVTETPVGAITVVGVCIPWRDAHVRTGRKDREPWQDHLAWLEAFETLAYRDATSRTIILGDFNQRIPRKYTPESVHEALLRAFKAFAIPTAKAFDDRCGPLIDHVAHSADLELRAMNVWPRRTLHDEPMSDHCGVWCDLSLRA